MEDAASVAVHVKWLQKEFKRARKDMDGVTDRMNRTYVDRKLSITQLPVKDVLDKYVFLQDPVEACSTFLLQYTLLHVKTSRKLSAFSYRIQ